MSDEIRTENVLNVRRQVIDVLANNDISIEEGCIAILGAVSFGVAFTGDKERTFQIEPGFAITVSIVIEGE